MKIIQYYSILFIRVLTQDTVISLPTRFRVTQRAGTVARETLAFFAGSSMGEAPGEGDFSPKFCEARSRLYRQLR